MSWFSWTSIKLVPRGGLIEIDQLISWTWQIIISLRQHAANKFNSLILCFNDHVASSLFAGQNTEQGCFQSINTFMFMYLISSDQDGTCTIHFCCWKQVTIGSVYNHTYQWIFLCELMRSFYTIFSWENVRSRHRLCLIGLV